MTIRQLLCSHEKSGTSGFENISLKSHPSSRPVRKWFLWIDSMHSPYLNMAFDEQCYNECDKLQGPLVRFYEWDRPAISIGYFQRYDSISLSGYSLVRRPTGGGIVFHGQDITYSMLFPSSHSLYKMTRRESYRVISDVIIKSLLIVDLKGYLSEKETVPTDRHRQICFNNPARFDVLVDREKVAGAAQKRNRHGLLHQGSINISQFPHIEREQLKHHLIAQFQLLFECKMTSFKPRSELLNLANILSQKKFCTPEWNTRR